MCEGHQHTETALCDGGRRPSLDDRYLLAPNGIPTYVAVFDDGGDTVILEDGPQTAFSTAVR